MKTTHPRAGTGNPKLSPVILHAAAARTAPGKPSVCKCAADLQPPKGSRDCKSHVNLTGCVG